MKRREPALVVLVVILAAVGWWYAPRNRSTPEKAAQSVASAPNKVATTLSATPPLVAPPAASAVKQSEAAADATAAPDPNAFAKAELQADVREIARLKRNGDFVDFYLTYILPDKIDQKIVEDLQKTQANAVALEARSPEATRIFQDLYDMAARSWEAMENQTPTFNPAGDEATYKFSLVDANGAVTNTLVSTITFIRINGKWYIKPREVKE
ncbi:MAG TPA: hypothetical protein VHM90_16590 [Phycisphaerae bacterium]|nr:hypothetical protein [Phycisphaerae bacterium]